MVAGALVQAHHGQQASPPSQPPAARRDFVLRVQPDAITVRRGANARAEVKVEAVGGFSGSVWLSSSFLLGTDIALAPQRLDTAGSATLTIAPGRSAIKGSYVVTITAIDGGISHDAVVRVTVR